MLTVAKSVDAPIKLLFPKNWTATPPEFSLLGLGDIVLPGVFIALCLRYDVVKSVNTRLLDSFSRDNQAEEAVRMLVKGSSLAAKTYFNGALIGYMVAIITTVIVMLVFDHG